jgi:hypothetical protein
MLTIFTDGHHRTCQGYTRREMLQVGTLVVSSANVFATIMSTLIDPAELRVTSGVPSNIAGYLADSQPIPQLA